MPNENKKLNFTFKIWDSVAQDYRPVYIAPDATDAIQGDVKLSDSTTNTLNAATGMTAATPAAVKAVQDSANNKLDKISSSDQNVASAVTFSNSITVNKGITVPTGYYFIGNLQGNADTATALETARQFSVKVGNAQAGTATFNGSANAVITVPQVDASVVTTGTLPLSVIPQGAMERLVKVENESARFALTADDVQLGDSVLQLDTDVMYVVVDIAELDNAAGYEEYAAGTALLAETAEKVQYGLAVQKNGVPQFTFDGSSAQTLNLAMSFDDLTGQLSADQIPNGLIEDEKISFNYAGSDTKGGVATSAAKLATPRSISLGGILEGTTSFDGSEDITLVGDIADGSITENLLANNAVTTSKLSDNSVTSAKIVNGTIMGADIANATITGTNIASTTITAANIAANTITSTQIADKTISEGKIADSAITSAKILDGTIQTADLGDGIVSLSKLGEDVGTVAVQAEEPADSNVLIWVQI